MFLGYRLKIARAEAGYTQQAMADILGIDRSAYTCYEINKIQPSSEMINKFSALFKIDTEWFFGEDVNSDVLSEADDIFTLKKQIKESGLLELTDEEKELIGLYRLLRGTSEEDKLNEVLKNFQKEISRDKCENGDE